MLPEKGGEFLHHQAFGIRLSEAKEELHELRGEPWNQ